MLRQLCGLAVLGFAAALLWHGLARMSPDALSMGLGICMGIAASMPITVVVLMAERRRQIAEQGFGSGRNTVHPSDASDAVSGPQILVLLGTGSGLVPVNLATRTVAGWDEQDVVPRRHFFVVGQEDAELTEW